MRRYRNTKRTILWGIGIGLVALAASPAGADLRRTKTPAPPDGGPGEKTLAVDIMREAGAPPGFFVPPSDEAGDAGEHPVSATAATDKAAVHIGGDDVVVSERTSTGGYFPSTAYDSQGNGYMAQSILGDYGYEVVVHRSTDSGRSWQEWGVIRDITPGYDYRDAYMVIAEGLADRCFVAAYKRGAGSDYVIAVCRADLGTPTASFSEIATIEVPGEDVYSPHLATDAASFGDYYLYLVARSFDGTNSRIWFTRSTDQGASWESEYVIGQVTSSFHTYEDPVVAYGYNGKVHVAWDYDIEPGAGALRYRRANSFASGGLGSWDSITAITAVADGYEQRSTKVAAVLDGDEVLIASIFTTDTSWDVEIRASADQGATWTVSAPVPGVDDCRGLAWQPTTDQWLVSDYGSGSRIYRAPVADPTAWSGYEYFIDSYPPDIASGNTYPFALNPARDYRIGAFWAFNLESGTRITYHDAEWLRDPGWPDEEEDSPFALAAAPRSAPAVVDLDDDGDLEIVFADVLDRVVALHHDGTDVAGWPVKPGPTLVGSPVAVGDINGDGVPEIAAGSMQGEVYLYGPDGTLHDGWPAPTRDAEPAHVSIGTLGPPYHRVVVACAGNYVNVYNFSGHLPAGYNLPATIQPLEHPAAIGDIDADGSNELVIAGSTWIAAYHPTSSANFSRTLPSIISDAPTLGDIDLDGNVEVFVPTVDGVMYALEGSNGADLPGWPYDTGVAMPLSSATLAQCRGTYEPEIAFARQDYTVYLMWDDGTVCSGYPENTGSGWWIFADPIMLPLEGSGDVVIGARDHHMWAWNNFGTVLDGWPRDQGDHVHQTAAAGDVDADGNVEVVVLSLTEMRIYDVHEPPATASRTWGMQGYDARRTGCWNCPEDLTTGVGDDPAAAGITRVAFALDSANPASGQAQFKLALPERAAVALEVFDVRGRLVRTVARTEAPAGEHVAAWDGRDDAGRRVASGQYMARLRVRGPNLDETVVRKVTWVR